MAVRIRVRSLRLSRAILRGFVDSASFSLADSDDGHGDGAVLHAVDQPVACTAQLDLVMVGHPMEGIGWDMGMFEALDQLLFELGLQGCAEFLPFLQSRWQELEIIAHPG